MRRTKEEAMQTRERVLAAAAHLIAHQGINVFTIEAVAQEASLTKGGVLHHFPSKDALISGLIEEVFQTFNTRLNEELQSEPIGQPGRWLRAYIRTVFSVEYEEKNLLPSLAAVLATDHQLVERIRQSFEKNQQLAVQDGTDPMEATLIRLVVDGLVFARALNIDVLDQETSREVYEELVRRTR